MSILNQKQYDDLFRKDKPADVGQQIIRIPLSELYPFPNHPYRVQDDEKMAETAESIKENGVLYPAIVRPREGGGYELVSGHRRKRACELAGLSDMPAIVHELDDDAAIIYMVDSNLQRESLLPSEKAFAYKMRLDAMKRKAGRPKNNSRQLVGNYESADLIGENAGESGRQVQRFIRLTELNPTLLEMVDNKELPFVAAVEVSYLSDEQQGWLMDVMEKEDCPHRCELKKKNRKK